MRHGNYVTIDELDAPARWTHLLCTGCGNVVSRADAVTLVRGSNAPAEVLHTVVCATPTCPSHGTELMCVCVDVARAA